MRSFTREAELCLSYFALHMPQRQELNEAAGTSLLCPRSHPVFSPEQHADLTKSLSDILQCTKTIRSLSASALTDQWIWSSTKTVTLPRSLKHGGDTHSVEKAQGYKCSTRPGGNNELHLLCSKTNIFL